MSSTDSARSGLGRYGFKQTLISQLLEILSAEPQTTLRNLMSALRAPMDAPLVGSVIDCACLAVAAYGSTLTAPTDEFRRVEQMLKTLQIECKQNCTTTDPIVPDDPLRRRLLRNPAWALLIEFSKAPPPRELLVATGTELAYDLAVGKPFPVAYATNLRRALNPDLDFLSANADSKEEQPAWLPHYRKVSREAAKIFEAAPLPPEKERQKSFAETAVNELTGKSLFPETRHRQGILDRSHLSATLLVDSASALRSAAVDGSDDAALAILASHSGLSLRTTHRMPLAGTGDVWVIELDVEAGVLRTDLDHVFPKSARPKSSDAHRSACRVTTKPLPQFLAQAMLRRLEAHPDARTVADLLPLADCNGRRLTLVDERFGIEPSTARFVNSAAGFAIQLGIDRLSAAILANDFGVIPASKVYYCHVKRGEIWDAAEVVYGSLGWGTPTPLLDGMAFGSRVVPTRSAIEAWHQWFCDELDRLRPGRNATIASLVAFHNRFAEACAAITVFCLASRGTARIRFTADMLTASTRQILLFDKRVGHLPRPLPVPVNAVVAAQAGLWAVHCRAFDRRLEHLGIAANSPIRQRLQGVSREERVETFFVVGKHLKPQPISCHGLVNGWPERFGFEADFGRHFWETELRLAGVRSSVIDLLLRHQVVGIEGHRSTADNSLAKSFCDIVTAQETLLAELGIKPVNGLAKK